MYTSTVTRGRLSSIPSVPLSPDDPWHPYYSETLEPGDPWHPMTEPGPDETVTEVAVIETPPMLRQMGVPALAAAGAVLGWLLGRKRHKSRNAMIGAAGGIAAGLFLNR